MNFGTGAIMNWYKKAQSTPKPFNYLGQCDKMRCDQIGEDNWQNMIKNHTKIPQKELEANCSLEKILDEEENLNEFVASDPTSYFAKSWWGNLPCYYIMTSGFEFIFTPRNQ